MLKVEHGDLLKAKTEAIINTVNCVGVMGKGIALQFKQAFPANYEAYRRASDVGDVKLGTMHVFDTGSMIWPRYIINFPTKGHWKASSKTSDIERGLDDLKRVIEERNIKSVAVPPLGCGNGGLSWTVVEPLIRKALGDLPGVEVHLYAPEGAPEFDQMAVRTKKPNMTRGRALVLKLLGLYGAAGYRHSLLEVQKLTYFLQQAGEDLRLAFKKHHFGPYAENLNHVLQRIEGHYIRGYGDRSKEAEIAVLEGADEEAEQFLEEDKDARGRLARVASLIQGFETPYGLELLSTVHWLASSEESPSAEKLLREVQSWNRRKAQLIKEPHIRVAVSQLESQGWMGGGSTGSREAAR
jgi:O-acetyl-ADP-ribose deacetylase (regulator of RNase III)